MNQGEVIAFLIKLLNHFYMQVPIKEIIPEIAKEAVLPDPLEQQILLTRLRVKRLKKKGIGTIARPPKNLKSPTMKQIDKWKHESRSSS